MSLFIDHFVTMFVDAITIIEVITCFDVITYTNGLHTSHLTYSLQISMNAKPTLNHVTAMLYARIKSDNTHARVLLDSMETGRCVQVIRYLFNFCVNATIMVSMPGNVN